MTTAQDWTGRTGDVWAEEWRRTDRSFTNLTPYLDVAILAAEKPRTRRVIDIGCGAGATSLDTAKALPDARVTGIDLSPNLVEIARGRAGTSSGTRFDCADVTTAAATHAPVDLYISRHGVMFFADPVAAFAALADAAAPDAALVFSCFAERTANRWAVETIAPADGTVDGPSSIAPGPFAFADPEYVGAILKAAGWQAIAPQRVTFAYRAGGMEESGGEDGGRSGRESATADPVADAVDYFQRIGPAASLIRDAPPEERVRHIARLTQVCERYRNGDTVEFPAAAWIWTARKSAH